MDDGPHFQSVVVAFLVLSAAFFFLLAAICFYGNLRSLPRSLPARKTDETKLVA